MAFCKIHHIGYDCDIVGVRPDGVAQVRRGVLEKDRRAHAAIRVTGGARVRLLLPRSPASRPSVEGLERGGRGFGRRGESSWFRSQSLL